MRARGVFRKLFLVIIIVRYTPPNPILIIKTTVWGVLMIIIVYYPPFRSINILCRWEVPADPCMLLGCKGPAKSLGFKVQGLEIRV